MRINSIYSSWDGEQNKFGIGYPTIFVRTQGCHLRCYQKTLGILCDTPEGLEKEGGMNYTIPEIFLILEGLRRSTGISKITFSGGDPLWRSDVQLHEFFQVLYANDWDCTVETSGTLPIAQYATYSRVWWVLDYKLPSAGLGSVHHRTVPNFNYLKAGDFVKFVVADQHDLDTMADIVRNFPLPYGARYTTGLFWGCEMPILELYTYLQKNNLLGKVSLNFQVHKLSLDPNFITKIPALL